MSKNTKVSCSIMVKDNPCGDYDFYDVYPDVGVIFQDDKRTQIKIDKNTDLGKLIRDTIQDHDNEEDIDGGVLSTKEEYPLLGRRSLEWIYRKELYVCCYDTGRIYKYKFKVRESMWESEDMDGVCWNDDIVWDDYAEVCTNDFDINFNVLLG